MSERATLRDGRQGRAWSPGCLASLYPAKRHVRGLILPPPDLASAAAANILLSNALGIGAFFVGWWAAGLMSRGA